MEISLSCFRLKQVQIIVNNQENNVITVKIFTIEINQITFWQILVLKIRYGTVNKDNKTN